MIICLHPWMQNYEEEPHEAEFIFKSRNQRDNDLGKKQNKASSRLQEVLPKTKKQNKTKTFHAILTEFLSHFYCCCFSQKPLTTPTVLHNPGVIIQTRLPRKQLPWGAFVRPKGVQCASKEVESLDSGRELKRKVQNKIN